MLITKEIEIDMGHRVPNHKSKCKNLHGHRYKIEAGVDDKVIEMEGSSDEGMVIDFGDLKEVMMQEIDKVYDHKCVLFENDPLLEYDFFEQNIGLVKVPFIPTAENLAKHWFKLLEDELFRKGIKLRHVKIWETPTSTATYQE